MSLNETLTFLHALVLRRHSLCFVVPHTYMGKTVPRGVFSYVQSVRARNEGVLFTLRDTISFNDYTSCLAHFDCPVGSMAMYLVLHFLSPCH